MFLKIARITVRIFLVVLIFLIIFVLVFDRLVQFRVNDKDLMAWFQKRKLSPHIRYYSGQGRTVRYLQSGDKGDSSQATVLFIHGAPSSLSFSSRCS